jgi:tetratricopeptide (TPR) repeat protein
LLLCFDLNAEPKNNNYKGIGFEALDYEKEAGFEVKQSSYLLLQNIIKECESRIILKPQYSYDESVEVLKTIGSVIQRFYFEYDFYQKCTHYFSKSLDFRKFDCRTFTMTYLTVGENLSLPLFCIFVPHHVFICWKDSSNEIFWETTNNIKTSKQFYIDSLKIKNEFESTPYFHPIDYKQSRSMIYSSCGIAKYLLGNIKGSIADYNKAIEINSNSFENYYNRGLSKYCLRDNNGAIQDFKKAIEINPFYNEAFFNMGKSKAILGRNKEAISDFDKVIEIDSNYTNIYFVRGFAKNALSDYKGAISDYNKAIEINPNDAPSYYQRGNAKYNLFDDLGACQDWKKAKELNLKEAETKIKKYCR